MHLAIPHGCNQAQPYLRAPLHIYRLTKRRSRRATAARALAKRTRCPQLAAPCSPTRRARPLHQRATCSACARRSQRRRTSCQWHRSQTAAPRRGLRMLTWQRRQRWQRWCARSRTRMPVLCAAAEWWASPWRHWAQRHQQWPAPKRREQQRSTPHCRVQRLARKAIRSASLMCNVAAPQRQHCTQAGTCCNTLQSVRWPMMHRRVATPLAASCQLQRREAGGYRRTASRGWHYRQAYFKHAATCCMQLQ